MDQSAGIASAGIAGAEIGRAGPRRVGLGRAPVSVQWAVLVGLSMAVSLALHASGLPASLLLGPMAAAIVASVLLGVRVGVPRAAYYGAQAVVGCLIASTFKPSTLVTVGQNWAVFLSVVVATYAASLALGYAMSRMKILPGSTAVWGSAPGAASAMMLMAEAFGADPQLVAFMQYLRVVFVALAASLIARLWVVPEPGGLHHPFWSIDPASIQLLSDHPLQMLATLAFAAAGAVVGRRLGIPAGPLLVPMAAGIVLRLTGVLTLELPPWVLTLSYAFVGWKIGLGFTRDVFARAARATVPIIVNVLILIAMCGGLAVILVKGFGIDPLTAYLATSPGGMDSIAIIGASTKADLPFVMALHAMRFTIVLTLGPAMARVVARWAERA